VSDCIVCNDRRLVGGFSPSWCPVCSGHAMAIDPEKLAKVVIELADVKTERDLLTANLAACREDLAKAEARIAEVTRERDRWHAEAERIGRNYTASIRERDAALSDRDSLKARLAEVEKERDELVNAVVTGPLKGKTAEQEILSLRARLESVGAVYEAAVDWAKGEDVDQWPDIARRAFTPAERRLVLAVMLSLGIPVPPNFDAAIAARKEKP